MIRRLLIFCVLLVIAASVMGQLERSGTPVSWNISQELNGAFSGQTMSAIDAEALLSEDAVTASDRSIPFRFAYAHSVNLNPANSGHWTNLHNGDRLWLLGIDCPGAFSIALTFSDFDLPKGARIYIYSEDHSDYIGPLSAKDNTDDYLGTPHISGDKIFIEYYEPYAYRGQGDFSIRYVAEAYRNLRDQGVTQQQPCLHFLDVESAGPSVVNASSSVMMMLVDYGQRVATATLINNTASDATPYALAASSALLGHPSSWVFMFDIIRDNCWQASGGCTSQTLCGAEVAKTDAVQGICLLRLADSPRNNWAAYYSGWRLSVTENLASYTCIQHGLGSPQSLANYDGTIEVISTNNQNTRALRSSNGGNTFQGSVGSPLFDGDLNMIGIFVGGDSDCDGNGKDYFVMLSDSWMHFKDFLDPFSMQEQRLSGFYPRIEDSESATEGMEIGFFPNPAKSWIYVQNDSDELLLEIRISDASGRVVRRLNPMVPTVSLDGLPEGVYTICFIAEGGSKLEKLLIR